MHFVMIQSIRDSAFVDNDFGSLTDLMSVSILKRFSPLTKGIAETDMFPAGAVTPNKIDKHSDPWWIVTQQWARAATSVMLELPGSR